MCHASSETQGQFVEAWKVEKTGGGEIGKEKRESRENTQTTTFKLEHAKRTVDPKKPFPGAPCDFSLKFSLLIPSPSPVSTSIVYWVSEDSCNAIIMEYPSVFCINSDRLRAVAMITCDVINNYSTSARWI